MQPNLTNPKAAGNYLAQKLATYCHRNGIDRASIAMVKAGARTTACVGEGVSPASRFLIYSNTKSFIAATVLHVLDLPSLDLPLSTWLPQFPLADHLTVRRLLNHTSGLPDYGPLPQYHLAVRESPSQPWNDETFLTETLGEPAKLAYEPGRGWEYSNIGYMALRQALERLGGDSFTQSVLGRICAPLRLNDTTFATTLADIESLCPAYSSLLSLESASVDVRHHYHPGWVSHGVLASTASDLACFYDALFGGQLLPADKLEAMLATIPVQCAHPLFQAPSYSLGLMADPQFQKGRLYGHTGGGPGYSSAAYHCSINGTPTTVAVLLASECAEVAEQIAVDVLIS